MAIPYLDSDKLIAAVRRRCSLPEAKGLLSDDDILEFANDEMMESILPAIKSSQEEYFVWNQSQSIESGISRYKIPERAIGNALRDISFEDVSGNEYEMTRIHRDDRYSTQFPSTYSQPYRYYVENSDIVIVPDVGVTNATGQLNMAYLLRPNQLVKSERVAKIQQIANDFVQIASITIGSSTTIVTDGEHFLESDETVTLSAVTGTGASLLNTSHSITVIDSVTFTIDVDTTSQGPFSGGLVYNNTTKLTCNQLPTNISDYVDILKTRSPHNTLAIDVPVLKIVYTSKTITVKTSYIPTDLEAGDTIASTYETDIPGIPTELHRLLVTKTVERVMETIGDQNGLNAALRKSIQSEQNSGKLIENRVTSAPLKVKNTNGFLSRNYRRTRRF